ncbi:MAG: nucleotidyltransferase family protein, partial [Candidatus Saccharimonas sp.]|nr:nucleotidyltransferase family protein [Planctomycetaceae bacterium]
MTTTAPTLGPFDLERVFRAVDKITERLNRAAAALNTAGVPYAVIGGNAVANWVGRVKPEAIRFTKDVDLLIRRADVDAAEEALKPIGFRRHQALGITFFLDGPDSKFEDAIHL